MIECEEGVVEAQVYDGDLVRLEAALQETPMQSDLHHCAPNVL